MKVISIPLSLSLILLFFIGGSTLAQERNLVTKEQLIQALKPIKLRGVKIEEKENPSEKTIYVFFKFGSTELADEHSRKQLKEVGEAFSSDRLSGYRFEISGHTDNIGTALYNQKLSERRALAIKKILIKKYGIPEGKLEVKGYGESKPIASNETAEGRATNRRVVLKRID